MNNTNIFNNTKYIDGHYKDKNNNEIVIQCKYFT